MNTTKLNTLYIKRYFYHNFIFILISIIVLILLALADSKKEFTFNTITTTLIISLILSCILLIPELIILFVYLKPKQVKITDGQLYINNNIINTEDIITITPITYNKNNWFANVIEIELNDVKFCFLDQSQFGNSKSKSLKALLDFFPELEEKVSERISTRKLYKY